MRFISNGDYIFPFGVRFYWLKQVYMWSYQTGSANPDGIIRMPGRILDLLVFALFGNIAIGYFYVLTCFIITYIAFFLYGKFFLKITNTALTALAALFFTANPISLGNISKVGLLLAAAMLPLCFVAIQRAFETKRLRYLLLYAVLLNISLIHPYTFTVNLVVSGAYLAYKAYDNWPFVLRNVPKLLLIGLVALLLNAYFVLPMANIGTVNKDVLSSDVTVAPTDYTSLIAIANTGDIFTGLALSKGVLKDYDFYNDQYQLLYLLGIFTFYIILFGVYVRVEKNLSKTDRRYFAWALAGFLVLLLLAAVNFLDVKVLIKLAVGLPGGWIFRSPLKWQLYIPFAMATMLGVVLPYLANSSHRRSVYVGLLVSFVLMNGYISVDIYHKLLTPRALKYFGALQQENLNQKNFLVVNDNKCFDFASRHSPVMTELNQVLISKNTQVKQISTSTADAVNLSSYDYVWGCQGTAQSLLKDYNFVETNSFANNAFQLYRNTRSRPYIYASKNLFALNKPQQVGNKYQMATQTLQDNFDFTDLSNEPKQAMPTVGLQDAYDGVSYGNIRGSVISENLSLPPQSETQKLYVRNGSLLQHSEAGNKLQFSPAPPPPTPKKGRKAVSPPPPQNQTLNLAHGGALHLSYSDPSYTYKNLLPNPSLEHGPWQKQVGDCYAFGGGGQVGMSVTRADKTIGAQSLQLTAKSHIACTGPNDIQVQAGQHYLLSFDYKSLGGRFAGYYFGFDDTNGTYFSQRLDDSGGKWREVTKAVTVPEGAKNMQLFVYAYPDDAGITTGTARYDHFRMAAIPNVQDRFYVVSTPRQVLEKPKSVSFRVENPTRSVVQVRGAKTAFYLETKDSYSSHWVLRANGKTVSEQDHLKVNNFMNGWYVDPGKLCKSGCQQNNDGSYDMTLVVEFAPQRWFYIGTSLSLVTFLGVVSYFVYDARRTTFHAGYMLLRGRK